MFGYTFDKRYLYIILVIMVITRLGSYTTEGILALLLSLPAVIIAITFHEYAHAFVADRLRR